MGKKAGPALPPGDLGQRAALVRRFKDLLRAQRDRFQVYLEALDRSRDVILRGAGPRDEAARPPGIPGELTRRVELEKHLVAGILALQKALTPLETMYEALPPGTNDEAARELALLRTALADLRTEAAARSARNRALLVRRMGELREELAALRALPYRRRPAFVPPPAPGRVDLRG